eukprot:UN32612
MELLLNLLQDPRMPGPVRFLLRTLEAQLENYVLKNFPNFDVNNVRGSMTNEQIEELQELTINKFKTLLLDKVVEQMHLGPELKSLIKLKIDAVIDPEAIIDILAEIGKMSNDNKAINELLADIIEGEKEDVKDKLTIVIQQEFRKMKTKLWTNWGIDWQMQYGRELKTVIKLYVGGYVRI